MLRLLCSSTFPMGVPMAEAIRALPWRTDTPFSRLLVGHGHQHGARHPVAGVGWAYCYGHRRWEAA